MKTRNTAIVVALLSASVCAFADDASLSNTSSSGLRDLTSDVAGRFGIGVMFGEPTGLSMKYFATDKIAVDGGIGWAFHHETDLHLHSDVLWHEFDLIPVPKGKLPLYFGVGLRLKIEDHRDDRFGIRLPIGVSYLFEGLPLDVFAEIAPVLDVAPETEGSFTGGVGVRWWF
ncbi:MAG: hypothetical protein QM813_17865 [Verrucomicrobiota bacterium]